MEEQGTSAPVTEPIINKKSPGKWIFIGAVVLIILIFGVVAFLYSKNASAPVVTPTPTITSTLAPEFTPLATSTSTVKPTASPTPKPTKSPTPIPTVTPTPTPANQTITLSSTASIDGFQSNNGGGNETLEIRAGRNMYLVTRGFASFDLGSLPSGATIEQATLRLYQTSVIGNPYGVGGGNIKVDHLDYGSTFDNSDYGIAALSASFTTLSSSATVGWKEADVTDALRDDRTNSRSRSQYRIHLAIEATGGDATGDFAYFESANNNVGTGNTPQLVVRYH
jgi:hypothetical protein